MLVKGDIEETEREVDRGHPNQKDHVGVLELTREQHFEGLDFWQCDTVLSKELLSPLNVLLVADDTRLLVRVE